MALKQISKYIKMNIKFVILPGAGISKSEIWFTFVRPGLGSKAGIRAENCLFNTNSSSQLLGLPFSASPSSSFKKRQNWDSLLKLSCHKY